MLETLGGLQVTAQAVILKRFKMSNLTRSYKALVQACPCAPAGKRTKKKRRRKRYVCYWL